MKTNIICFLLYFSMMGLTGCLETPIGLSAYELQKENAWGQPKDKIKINNSYEVWHYVLYGVDSCIFLKNGQVAGQLKYPPEEKIWPVVQTWAAEVKQDTEYQINLDKNIRDILQRRLRTGMTRTEVRLVWGRPVDEKKTHLTDGLYEEWTYEHRAVYRQTRLVFKNGYLINWEN